MRMPILLDRVENILGSTYREDQAFWNTVVNKLTPDDERGFQDVQLAYNSYVQAYGHDSVSLPYFF